jgi:hypothetical protein
MDPIAEIKKLYYGATKATINDDIDRAIDLLKTLPTEEERDRVAVYMEGLAQMRMEWKQGAGGGVKPPGSAKPTRATPTRASGRPGGSAQGRSGPSKASSRRSR